MCALLSYCFRSTVVTAVLMLQAAFHQHALLKEGDLQCRGRMANTRTHTHTFFSSKAFHPKDPDSRIASLVYEHLVPTQLQSLGRQSEQHRATPAPVPISASSWPLKLNVVGKIAVKVTAVSNTSRIQGRIQYFQGTNSFDSWLAYGRAKQHLHLMQNAGKARHHLLLKGERN